MILNKLNLPAESLRLQIKELAEEVRYKYSKKGLSDIFDILSEVAFLIRMPLKTTEVSGFSTYFEQRFVVFLNSSFTLGHERFSGAHELYHFIYNPDILKKEKLLLNNIQSTEDDKANIFAAEFLMPADYVKEVFYKIVNVEPDNVLPRHVVRMNNNFKVSYKAMLKRLVQLKLCSVDKYEELCEICSLANADKLQALTQKEGYDISLITPAKEVYIPQEYIEFVKSNYEHKKISFNNMKNCLEFLGLTAEQFGYIGGVQMRN
ncbi:MAG TPA: ImmA/IrrE family metallo-endopeptidase [Clostridia bacterium]|nr:ImmA/IrrE family metallo-endopeptidase [Clostridia bacterium]